MNDDKKYIEYDKVVHTIMGNILVERQRCGKFLIYEFQPINGMNKLYFNITALAADIQREYIYLDMSLWNYIKFWLKRKKVRKNLKWFGPFQKRKLDDDHKTSVSTIMNFICENLNISEDLYEKINNEYYGWIK